MYLSHIFIENFRLFGAKRDGKSLDISLKPGMNVFVGENDSGKTAIVDAIRIVLQTSSFDYYRLTENDFHLTYIPSNENSANTEPEEASLRPHRAEGFTIRCSFSDLRTPEIGRYLEWLSIDADNEPILHITFRAQRREESTEGRRRNRFPFTVLSGKEGDGPRIEGDIREFLRVTYLKPLRDAEAELTAGRGSRLSQILESHPDFEGQKENDYDPEGAENQVPKTLLGIFRQAEARITGNTVIEGTKAVLNSRYLKELALGNEELRGGIGVSRETELRQILEKLELWLEPDSASSAGRTRRGLGYNNILFMATELLLLGDTGADSFPMLLIEEPEAHLHPQMQLRLMAFLEQKSKANQKKEPGDSMTKPGLADDISEDRNGRKESQSEETSTDQAAEQGTTQVLLTTHSPNLASKANLANMILMCRGKAYPLDKDHTRLDEADYRFLERFLDVTKANLFFAKGVLMVEGDAENILLPVLADLLGRSFSKYGISVVNVGHTGFFRFARILQSKPDAEEVPLPVACLADRDIVPDEANYVMSRKGKNGEAVPTFASQFSEEVLEARLRSKKKADGARVKTFVSPNWTLEHDLAQHGLAGEVHAAIKAAKKEHYQGEKYGAIVTPDELETCRSKAEAEIDEWKAAGETAAQIAARVYRDLHKGNASKAITAQILAQILTDKRLTPATLQPMLPYYILEAIEHLTGPGLLSTNHAAPNNH